ncbi:MAG: hypothetical protein JWN78_3065 [Bacteroidota bacterium]|nr:hypothetical protein [Bacteroidota bacterium]
MKKFIYYLSFFFFSFISLKGNAQIQNTEPCGTKAPSAGWEQWFQSKIAERKANLAIGRISQSTYLIPVIVLLVWLLIIHLHFILMHLQALIT